MKTIMTNSNPPGAVRFTATLALFLLIAGATQAQTPEPAKLTVKGLVKSADDGKPLPNVNIWRKGTMNEGTITDPNGKFQYPKPLSAGEVLIFSFVGMERQEYVVPADYKEGAVIDLGMLLNEISEVVVTGAPLITYGDKAHTGIFRKIRMAFH
jgi:hypothetical protein